MSDGAKPIVIIGGGGHGRELHDILVAINGRGTAWDFLGFVDDHDLDAGILHRIGAVHLGDQTILKDFAGAMFVIGIGAPAARSTIETTALQAGLQPATLVHPGAWTGLDVEIGAGSVLCANVSITTNIVLGRQVHINRNATVGHDTRIDDFVTLHPGAIVSGDATLGKGVTLGTNSTVIPGVSVGANTTVGAGAVVIRDLPPGVTAVGVPARVLRR